MKKIRNLLLTIFVGTLCLAVCIVVLFETDVLECGLLATEKQSEFLWTTLMELITLATAFLTLRLFKFEKVHRDLTERRGQALCQWGVVRLLMLTVPLLANTLLYYIYMNPTFGYLAIILVLCLPFVYPSESRCQAEIES